MQRSTMIEANFITTLGATRVNRAAVGLVAIALVGTTPWMGSWSTRTLAQDAPTNEPVPEPAPEPPAEPAPATEPAPAQPSAEDTAAAQKAADEAAAAQKAAALDATRASAREAMSRNEWKSAIDLWSQVLAANPADAEAGRGMQRCQAELDQAAMLDASANRIELLRQRAKVQNDADVRKAESAMAVGDYAGASEAVAVAKVRLDREKGVFAAGEFDAMMARLDKLQDEIRVGKLNKDLAEQQRARETARAQAASDAQAQAEKRAAEIDNLLRRVRELQLSLKYDEALKVVEQILFLDPNNPSALALRDAMKTARLYRNYSATEKRRSEAIAQFSIDLLDRSVPPMPNTTGVGPQSTTGLVEYPDDWRQLSDMRLQYGASGYRESMENRRAMAALQTVNSFDFSNNTLKQALDYMNTVSGAAFYPDWKALETINVEEDSEVSLKLENVPVEIALKRVLEQFGDETERPDYSIEDGVIVVSSNEALRKKTIAIVYDIRDLLFEVPYFDNAPDFNLGSALQQGGQQGGQGGGQGGGGGGGGFGGGGGGFGGGGGGGGAGGGGGGIIGDPGEDPERKSRDELVEQITDIIQEQVDPEGWRDAGGDTGSIQELNGNLIITNTAKNHRDIEGLLSQLRAIRALQINYEARVIGVTSDWFEQIGIDLDLYFNTNDDMWNAARAADPNFNLSDFFFQDGTSQGQLKDPVVFGPLGVPEDEDDIRNTPATGAATGIPTADGTDIEYVYGPVGSPIRRQSGWTPIGFTQDSSGIVNQLGAGAIGGIGGQILSSGAAAATTGFSYLDDIQVDLLIQATQADQRNVVLTAPRLTLMNGQRSFITIAKQISFISGLTPVTGDASGAFQPQVGVVQDGFVLDIEGVISSDRRYVTMTVQFDTSTVLGFDSVPIQGAVGGTGTGGGRGSEFEASIQLPEIQVQSIRTTVSVPDKGTILMGGQRRFEEVELETGVPVLSKIPVVNRFFTNRIDSEQELTVVMLIRPEIVIQNENEDVLFPGLSEQLGNLGG